MESERLRQFKIRAKEPKVYTKTAVRRAYHTGMAAALGLVAEAADGKRINAASHDLLDGEVERIRALGERLKAVGREPKAAGFAGPEDVNGRPLGPGAAMVVGEGLGHCYPMWQVVEVMRPATSHRGPMPNHVEVAGYSRAMLKCKRGGKRTEEHIVVPQTVPGGCLVYLEP